MIAAGLAGVAAQQPAQGAKPTVTRTPAQQTASIEGKTSYDAYCASCHGKDGKGNGPAAVALKVPATDLTMLAKRNAGKYNKSAVLSSIKGFNTPAHGNAEMPVWGPIFSALDSAGITTLRLNNLADYIGTMQQK
jgi:mono/diheme cytochrome c family protein